MCVVALELAYADLANAAGVTAPNRDIATIKAAAVLVVIIVVPVMLEL
jgi:hypothetical protein